MVGISCVYFTKNVYLSAFVCLCLSFPDEQLNVYIFYQISSAANNSLYLSNIVTLDLFLLTEQINRYQDQGISQYLIPC